MADVKDREAQAIALRRQGLTYQAIADAMNISAPGAFQMVKRGLDRTLREVADDYRELEVQRLETALAAIWPKVIEGNLAAIDRMMRLVEVRAKLLGLNAPTKIEQEVTVFEGGTELDREVQRLAELLAANADSNSGSVETAVEVTTSAG